MGIKLENIVASITIASLMMGVAVSHASDPLPTCGAPISNTNSNQTGCQVAAEWENCSGQPFGLGSNYQVLRSINNRGYEGGYRYSCTLPWGRTGDCCTWVNIPTCPSNTCDK